MYILYAHHNDLYIKMSASTFSLVASFTSFCNALYLRAVLIRYFLLFPCLYLFNNPCFYHLKKAVAKNKLVFLKIYYLCRCSLKKSLYHFLYLFLSFVLIQKKDSSNKCNQKKSCIFLKKNIIFVV